MLVKKLQNTGPSFEQIPQNASLLYSAIRIATMTLCGESL